ncbi:LL-diaminopimelate aminotransferase [Caldalkalibacillus mannanilyticus]|uniref:LL-diaminopimelate aminotransferase n=1 Tax=Caldalkalibacillus mannanilyticus TaxID=1418 RepID=UPI00046A5A60|nr:LL-diaminopimelate aminotransferase [Caldalkalibacillus mannanilyticus]
MIQPSQRLHRLTTSVFSQLATKKAEYLRQGKALIDLSIGSPDQSPPQFIRESLSLEVQKEDQYGYSITATEEFKQAVAVYYQRRFGVQLKSSQVLQLMGSQDGLAHLALSYLDPGDVVIVPNPGYPIYSASVHIAGAELYEVPLREANDYKPDLSKIPAEICRRAKLMILNYPGNPISSLVDASFFAQVIAFAKANQILLIHDFAYAELIFDGHTPLSIMSLPGAEEVAIEFNSLSKSFNMAGCRIGYIVGKEEYLEPLALLKSHIDYGVFLPIQKAATLALTSDYHFLTEHTKVYQQRRDAFLDVSEKLGWKVRKPDGGMFIWARIPERWSSSLDFTLAALEQGVIVTPGHAFGSEGEGYVRIALVQDVETLREAAHRLERLF